MGVEFDHDKVDELVRLTRENNRMLHSMRRSAFIGGLFKLLMYATFLIVPLWFYMQYIAPQMQQVLEMYQQVQGTSARAQTQFSQFGDMLKQFQSLYGGGQ